MSPDSPKQTFHPAELDQGSSSTLNVDYPPRLQHDHEKKVQERQEAPSDSDIEQHEWQASDDNPPNGGIKAWLQVLAAFFFFMNSWGLINTFDVFQTFYKSTFLATTSNSNIAWIGSIRAFVLLGSPAFYGPLFDLGHIHILAGYGTFMVAFGIMMTSLCTTLWQFILAQGLVVGLGSGALFLTAVAIIPTWFSTRKSLAMGIAASGSSIGGVIYPIVFRYLEPQMGFPWSVRVMAFITLATSTSGTLLIKQRHAKPEQRCSIFDANLLREPTFTLWSLAWFLGNMGLYIPYFFIQDYANVVLHQSKNLAFWTLTTINAASVFGRIIPGLIADRTNDPLLIITLCTTATTILSWSWLATRTSMAGLFTFCAFYGFFSGAFVSLSTPATVHLAPSMNGIGTRLGIFNGIGSLGLLIGNPVAGAIVESSGYQGMQAFCGVACVAALGGLVVVLGRSGGWLGRVRGKGEGDEHGDEKGKNEK